MSRLVCAIWFSNTIGIFAGDQEVHSSQQAADGAAPESPPRTSTIDNLTTNLGQLFSPVKQANRTVDSGGPAASGAKLLRAVRDACKWSA